jgi:orotidine-5'-phosphate decarboxylase
MPAFFERLAARIERVDSVVSVGLDPDPDRIPAHLQEGDLPRFAFNRRIVDATHEYAAAYKPNAAFYEDPEGWRALEETIAYAHGKDVPVVLDGKRADIGNTARQYARLLDSDAPGPTADAITTHPYMGRDSLSPFLSQSDRGVFVLCRTSNAGSADLQELELAAGDPLYERVATLADTWNEHDNVGLVVGATHPAELEAIRQLVPDLPFLVPGVGAQGGDADAAVTHGLADRAAWPVGVGLVNSSRGIIFAGDDRSAGATGDSPDAFAAAAGEAARRLRDRLNAHR